MQGRTVLNGVNLEACVNKYLQATEQTWNMVNWGGDERELFVKNFIKRGQRPGGKACFAWHYPYIMFHHIILYTVQCGMLPNYIQIHKIGIFCAVPWKTTGLQGLAEPEGTVVHIGRKYGGGRGLASSAVIPTLSTFAWSRAWAANKGGERSGEKKIGGDVILSFLLQSQFFNTTVIIPSRKKKLLDEGKHLWIGGRTIGGATISPENRGPARTEKL